MTEEQCEAYFCQEEQLEISGSKGTANFIKKWPGEQTQSYLKMVDVKKVTGATSISGADSDKFTTLFAIECRGLEPVSWMPKHDFTIRSSGGSTVFSEVEIDEGFW